MKECAKKCSVEGTKCQQKDCRLWLEYPNDLNCTLIAVKKNGPMTLREVSERLGISFVRVKQIESEVLNKLKKRGVSKGLKD